MNAVTDVNVHLDDETDRPGSPELQVSLRKIIDRHVLSIGPAGGQVSFYGTLDQLEAAFGAALNQLPGGLEPDGPYHQAQTVLLSIGADPSTPLRVRDAVAVVRGHIADLIDREGDQ